MSREKFSLLSLLLAGLCACHGIDSVQDPAADPVADAVRVRRLSERAIVVSLLEANVTAVRTGDGILLVDTGRSPTLMRHVLRRIGKELGESPVRFVVNTHGHWDHTSGNQVLPDAILIGHEGCPEYMRQFPADSARNLWYQQSLLSGLREDDMGEVRAAGIARAREILLEDLDGIYKVTPPSRLLRDELSLNLGEVTVKLHHPGSNHTGHDVIVHVLEEALLVTGDLFTSPESLGFPVNAMTDISRLIETMERIAKESPSIRSVVPGHGEPMDGADLAAILKNLRERESVLRENPSVASALRASIESLGLEAALRRYEEGLLEVPGAGPVSEEEWDVLGFRLMEGGRPDGAVAVLEEAVRALPDSALLHDSLGEAYLKQGARAAARKSYGRSLELNPYNRNASEMLKILEERR